MARRRFHYRSLPGGAFGKYRKRPKPQKRTTSLEKNITREEINALSDVTKNPRGDYSTMRGSIEMVPISTILDTLRFFKVFFIGTREPRETRVVLISLRQKMIKEMKRRGFNEARLKKMIE